MRGKNRLLSFVLLVVMLLPLIPAAGVTVVAADNYGDPELARAVNLGFGAYRTDNPTVTFAEFMKMLDRTVELADASKLAEWKKRLPEARESDKKMKRWDGMSALIFAVETLGGEFLQMDIWSVPPYDNMIDTWDDMIWDDMLAKYDSDFAIIYTDQKSTFGSTHGVSAWFYSWNRVSKYSGKTIFEIDLKTNSMRPKAPFSYTEALLAALRLADSKMPDEIIERVMTVEDFKIFAKAEERKQAILNSPTEVKVTGKKYYVSNNGNDENDGLTPETAWATLVKVNGMAFGSHLKSGDGVFFERGGIWRGQIANHSEGITYSAYGEGPKPKIIYSPESGVGKSKWQLWYDKDGKKIWKFYEEMRECGNIVFNDGESYAVRMLSRWDGKKAVFPTDPNKKFDIVEGLSRDLTFYSTFNDNEISKLPIDSSAGDLIGPVYLRCDKGNPGELYKSIEFQSNMWGFIFGIISAKNNVTIDNLCLMYINYWGIMGADNMTVQNCEIAWCGGTVFSIDPESPWVDTDGGSIYCGYTNNVTVRNNYFHETGSIGWEANSENDVFENINVTGNLFERCDGGVCIGGLGKYKNINISNNYILYSGNNFRMDNTKFSYGDKAKETPGYPFRNALHLGLKDYVHEEIYIKNNIFYLSESELFTMGLSKNNIPHFSGNTYVQNTNGIIVNPYMCNIFSGRYPLGGETFAVSDDHLKYFVENILGDKTAKILPLSPRPGNWKVGEKLGDVLYSDITAYINGQAIPTSIKNGATMVVVEDLAKYGFDVKWDGVAKTLKVELNKSKKFEPLPVEKNTKPVGTYKCDYVYTDIRTYLSGMLVESYAIKGVTLIDFELLAKYGKLTWDGKTREIRLTIN